jgi:DNA polymerase III subunit delta
VSALNREQLENALKANRIDPLYLLIGEETFLRDATAQSISDAALSDTLLRDFNEHIFNLLTESPREAVTAAEQLPMMSARRVIRISHFGKLREEDEEILSRYVERPNDTTVMIFIAQDLDRRKKLTKSLLDSCVIVNFPVLKDGEAKQWVRGQVKRMKLTIEDQALSELIDMIGPNIQTLHSELEKLASAAANTGHISREIVEELTGRSRELSNFALGDHIVARDRKRALETLHRLLEGGSYPVMLIGSLSGTYHKLALAKEILGRGSRDDLFRAVPMPSWKRNDFITSLEKLDKNRIARGIQLIAAADLAIKTSQATPRLQLEMLVCELAA